MKIFIFLINNLEIKSNETMKMLNDNGLSLTKSTQSAIEKEYLFGKIIFKNILWNRSHEILDKNDKENNPKDNDGIYSWEI